MHLQPVYASAQAEVTGAAQRLFEHGLALPSGSVLSDADVARVLERIEEFLDAAR